MAQVVLVDGGVALQQERAHLLLTSRAEGSRHGPFGLVPVVDGLVAGATRRRQREKFRAADLLPDPRQEYERTADPGSAARDGPAPASAARSIAGRSRHPLRAAPAGMHDRSGEGRPGRRRRGAAPGRSRSCQRASSSSRRSAPMATSRMRAARCVDGVDHRPLLVGPEIAVAVKAIRRPGTRSYICSATASATPGRAPTR